MTWLYYPWGLQLHWRHQCKMAGNNRMPKELPLLILRRSDSIHGYFWNLNILHPSTRSIPLSTPTEYGRCLCWINCKVHKYFDLALFPGGTVKRACRNTFLPCTKFFQYASDSENTSVRFSARTGSSLLHPRISIGYGQIWAFEFGSGIRNSVNPEQARFHCVEE